MFRYLLGKLATISAFSIGEWHHQTILFFLFAPVLIFNGPRLTSIPLTKTSERLTSPPAKLTAEIERLKGPGPGSFTNVSLQPKKIPREFEGENGKTPCTVDGLRPCLSESQPKPQKAELSGYDVAWSSNLAKIKEN